MGGIEQQGKKIYRFSKSKAKEPVDVTLELDLGQ